MAACALALVFLVSFGVALNHRATALHGYCSEHGEQIHLGHDVAGAAGSPLGGLERPVGQAEGAHDCTALALLAQQWDLRQGSSTRQTSAWIRCGAGCARGDHPPIPLIFLSPSTSPPAA